MSGHNKLIEFLENKIPHLEQFRAVLMSCEQKAVTKVFEIGEMGSVILVVFLSRAIKKNLVWVCSDKKQARRLYDGLGAFSVPVMMVEDREDLARAVEFTGVLLVTTDQVLIRGESVHQLRSRKITFQVGGAPLDLSEKLSSLGFERVKEVLDPYQFAIRGDILDICDLKGLFRIQFFGQEIESIEDKRNRKKLEELDFYPNSIGEGNDWVLGYYRDRLLVFQNKDVISGQIIKSVQSYKDELSKDDLADLVSLQNLFSEFSQLYLESFSDPGDQGFTLSWGGVKNYARNTQDLIKDLGNTREGESVFIVSHDSSRFKNLLSHNDLYSRKEIALIDFVLPSGVYIPQLKTTILTDLEIVGSEERVSKKKKKLDFSAITNLKVGEFVVHIDHGVGRFTGFGTVTVDSITREYIFIEYSGGDTVYCPLDQADKITKYIAVGNTEPKLSHLASGQWEKIRAKVKAAVEEVAKELIDIQALREKTKPFSYLDDSREQEELAESFGHILTTDQEKAIRDILSAMKEARPMDYLLCGDVGYGKTEVAIRAALRAVVSGGQVAFLVPTTILAEQHVQTLENRLGKMGVRIASLSRFVSASDQKKALTALSDGLLDIIVGTHRLLSSDVKFKNLMLVVIDEEQKFGVRHKEKLKKMRAGIDILTMTATPIPRTLYMGLSGLKDISLIQTAPEGRLPIKTMVVKKEDEIFVRAIRQELARGGQIYIVHNRVETIEAFAKYISGLVPELTYCVAHGQMKEGELAGIINDFSAGKFHALICSTIIESGLDISTVNTIIVDRATNFGISQLHQLRGRIGRGSIQAYAYFLYNERELVGDAQKRLASIVAKGDLGSGYELSLEDLDIRGTGNILGREQHGSMQMVGVGYYMKLLEEAVARLTGENSEVQTLEVKIDLPISAFIPDGLYTSEEQKIKSYQMLAGLSTEEEIYEFREKEKGVFGDLPEQYENLITVMRLKISARLARVLSISTQDVPVIDEYKKKRIVIQFDHDLASEERSEMLVVHPGWIFKTREAKIDLDVLGPNWLAKIQTTLEFLCHWNSQQNK